MATLFTLTLAVRLTLAIGFRESLPRRARGKCALLFLAAARQ
jgi:hypothetical protein